MDVEISLNEQSEIHAGDLGSADAQMPDIQDDAPPTTRDENYYLADGDCVIRVENVLFKVHRFLLTRDSSAFADMFSMPQENGAVNEMATDENPIRLYDEVNDFRALCWIIYALPMVYMEQAVKSSKLVKLSRIVSLFLIAHKYHFESHEAFARKVLQIQCSIVHDIPPQSHSYFSKCSDSRLESLLRIVSLTESASDDPSLTSTIQKHWLMRLSRNKASISYPLRVAETLGLRKFIGQLYYHELRQTLRHMLLIPGSTAYARPAHDLTVHQQLALYQGFWSLQRFWSDIRNGPIKTFNCPLGQQHRCNEIFKEFWPQYLATVAGRRFDPLLFLNSANNSLIPFNCHEVDISCIAPYLDDMVKTLQDNLADHFLGPLSTPPAM